MSGFQWWRTPATGKEPDFDQQLARENADLDDPKPKGSPFAFVAKESQ